MNLIVRFAILVFAVFFVGCLNSNQSTKETGDLSNCENEFMPMSKESCYLNYLNEHGLKSDMDWSVCEKLLLERDANACYNKEAWIKSDTTYCDKITNIEDHYSSKGHCYGELGVTYNTTQNLTLCEKLTNTREKDDCYYVHGTTYPDNLTICGHITDIYLKKQCTYYASNATVCDSIKNYQKMKDCIYNYSD